MFSVVAIVAYIMWSEHHKVPRLAFLFSLLHIILINFTRDILKINIYPRIMRIYNCIFFKLEELN